MGSCCEEWHLECWHRCEVVRQTPGLATGLWRWVWWDLFQSGLFRLFYW